MKKKPKSEKPKKKDLARIGELVAGRKLTEKEAAERDELIDRMIDWGEYRDTAGEIYRGSDGKKYAPHDERRLRRLVASLGAGNKQLRGALGRRFASQLEKVTQVTPRPDSMTETEALWLALRIEPTRKTVKYAEDLHPTQRELAEAMEMGVMDVNRLEKRMMARDDIRQFFAVLGIKARKPRGATVTTRK